MELADNLQVSVHIRRWRWLVFGAAIAAVGILIGLMFGTAWGIVASVLAYLIPLFAPHWLTIEIRTQPG